MKTYKTELNDIKKSFGTISETKIARDCGMLIERIITGNIFPNFHIYLKTPEERKTFLKIEKKWGAEYNPDTLKDKPGKAIGWYRDLVSVLPDHVRISPKILNDLNTVKINRNDAVHNRSVSESQAHHSLLSTINIITALNMLDESDDLTGIPIHIYLVFSSIKEKYEAASNTVADVSKIISDSNILLPQLMNVAIDKLYGIRPPDRTWKSFDINKKEDLVEIFINNGHCELDLEACFKVFNELGLFSLFSKGTKLQTALEHISSTEIDDKDSKFDAIPYINAMEIIIEQLSRDLNHANNFFKLADSIKRNYLNDMQISEQEDFALRENARTLGIDQEIYKVFKPNVVKEIEEHLIKYRTFGPESSDTGNADSEVEKNLINMIKLGTPLEAVESLAEQQGFKGDIGKLFSQYNATKEPVLQKQAAPAIPKGKKIPIWKTIQESFNVIGKDPVDKKELTEYILNRNPKIKKNTLHCQITIQTVNNRSRTNFPVCKKPRLCGGEYYYDWLFMNENKMLTRFDKIKHGIWEIYERDDGKLDVKCNSKLDDFTSDQDAVSGQDSTAPVNQKGPTPQGKKVPAYEKIRKAMESFGDGYIASYGDIMDYCDKVYGETKKSTFRTYIISCTVNHGTRVHYHPNKKPRTEIADSDVLYQVEKGKVVLYEPDKHGKWIISLNDQNKLVVENIS